MSKRRPLVLEEDVYSLHEWGLRTETREVFVSPNPEVDEIDSVVSNQFIRNIQFLDQRGNDPIVVHMNTNGGCWFYGMAMFDAIRAARSKIITVSWAHARSMSSVVPQAADVRIIAPNASFMVHFGSEVFEGDAKALLSYAKHGEELCERMLDIYAERCKATGPKFKRNALKTVKKHIEFNMKEFGDWFLTASEAVRHGFADGVLGSKGFESIEAVRKQCARARSKRKTLS